MATRSRLARLLLRLPLALVLPLVIATAPLAAEELTGTVQLVAKGGKPARGSDVGNAVVSFEPNGVRRGGAAPAPRTHARAHAIVTRKKEFLPRVLTVTRGSTVRFPNEDPILHNVFSVSPENAFDLGLSKKGEGKAKRFDAPGLVRVFCNVHHAMVAYVLVLDTPFFTSPDATGRFTLAGLPRGSGRLTVWHEQAEPWTVELPVPQGGPLAIRLEVTKPLIPPHLDKAGKSYGARRDRYDG